MSFTSSLLSQASRPTLMGSLIDRKKELVESDDSYS
jgi:hypothetical protein